MICADNADLLDKTTCYEDEYTRSNSSR